MRRSLLGLLVLLIGLAPATAQERPAPSSRPAVLAAGSFRITFIAARQPAPYSGRVYVVLGRLARPEPRQKMGDWSGGPQVFAKDVKDVSPGGSVVIDTDCLGFPRSFADAAQDEFYIQAIARRSPDSPKPGQGAGDLYSKPQRVRFDRADPGVLELRLSEVVEEPKFVETDRIKLVDMKSPCLSEFYGREVRSRAAVVLPEGWEDAPRRQYPTVYFITGFGGDHRSARFMQRVIPAEHAKDVLLVVPDPTSPLGHSVFADSANNGPRGRALVEELIPEVERRFHGAGDASRRYVTGISSGGWASLWLQVTYPDAFAGCWSHCPDPVDFRDFQRIDLYAPGANMYRDEREQRRPLARQGGQVLLWYDDFVRQETVMGPGGQIHAFEAVFSPRSKDGKPRPLFDRPSGKVDSETARTWEKYDIRLVLERHWKTLGPKLQGKLHIYAGEVDTFYLDGAARLFKESLEKLGSDAEVVIVPGLPHTMHDEGIKAMFETIGSRER